MHNKFTIVARVSPSKQGTLREMLAPFVYVCPDTSNDSFGFAQVKTLHFASLSLFDDERDGWSLVFEHNIDGTIDAHIDSCWEQ